jgi:hypothetical protein
MRDIMYTYDEELFSDFHKDAYGFRPRGHRFYDATPAEKQEIWDATCRAMKRRQAEEEEMEAQAVIDFEKEVQSYIELGAGDRQTALRWMTQNVKFYHLQSIEHWVWEQGILFTDEGRKLVEELKTIIKYEEEDE